MEKYRIITYCYNGKDLCMEKSIVLKNGIKEFSLKDEKSRGGDMVGGVGAYASGGGSV